MAVAVTPTQSEMLTKLIALIATIIPTGVQVIQGLGNRAAIPAGPFVAVTVISQRRMATNDESYTDDFPVVGTRNVAANWNIDVQVDFFGPLSGDWATAFATLFRDDYGCDFLAPECQPLYADAPRQAPWVSSESQWTKRWIVTASLNWNELVSVSQQFADAADVTLLNVDVEYPAA
jgi:hypothetical protein